MPPLKLAPLSSTTQVDPRPSLHRALKRARWGEEKTSHSRLHIVEDVEGFHVIFKYTSPTNKLLKLTKKDIEEFLFLDWMEKEGLDSSILEDEATS